MIKEHMYPSGDEKVVWYITLVAGLATTIMLEKLSLKNIYADIKV